MVSARVSTTPVESRTARNARIRDAPRRTGRRGAERVGEVLEEGVDDGVLSASLRAGGGLDVVVRGRGTRLHGRQVVDLVEDRLDGAADDDLVTVARLGDSSENAVNGLDRVLVDDGGIAQFEAQARCAVGEVCDVAGTTDRIEDFLCRVGHGGLLPWMRFDAECDT